MPLDRPPRAPAGAVTDRVRRAILAAADRLGIDAAMLLGLHAQAEHVGSWGDLIADVEERYHFAPGALLEEVVTAKERIGNSIESPAARRESAARSILYSLPDTEFLTVLEHAVEVAYRDGHTTIDDEALMVAADGALQAHGVPYRRSRSGQFEWVGDPEQHALTVEPALRALADQRLAGPQAEFEEACRKRRQGTPKALEDAVDEAAKAVESTLQVLHDEHGLPRPGKRQITPLFNSLVTANLLPGYVDKLVAGAAGPRNNMASHGQGGTVREVPEELAEASIAAAAVAITFLAHYLP